MNFSKQLKKYREYNHFTQEELAEKIYVTRQTISKWETEKSYPDIHNLIALSVLFQISLDELIIGDIEPMKELLSINNIKKYFWMNVIVFIILMNAPIILFKLGIHIELIIEIFLLLIFIIFSLKLKKLYSDLTQDEKLKNYDTIIKFLDVLEGNEKKRNGKKEIIIKSFISIILFILGVLYGFIYGYLDIF